MSNEWVLKHSHTNKFISYSGDGWTTTDVLSEAAVFASEDSALGCRGRKMFNNIYEPILKGHLEVCDNTKPPVTIGDLIKQQMVSNSHEDREVPISKETSMFNAKPSFKAIMKSSMLADFNYMADNLVRAFMSLENRTSQDMEDLSKALEALASEIKELEEKE